MFEIRVGELETGIPVRRRSEFLARLPFLAELIVGGTLLRVAEHFVGLADLLESGFSSRLLADVRMELASKLAKGPFDLVLRRAAFQPQALIVVLVFHGILRDKRAAVSARGINGIERRRTLGLSLADVQGHHGRMTK